MAPLRKRFQTDTGLFSLPSLPYIQNTKLPYTVEHLLGFLHLQQAAILVQALILPHLFRSNRSFLDATLVFFCHKLEGFFFSSCTLYLFLIFGLTACEILVLWRGIEPHSLHWKQGVLTTGPPGKVPRILKLGTQVLCLALPWNLLVIQFTSSLQWLAPKCVQAMKLSSYITSSAGIKKLRRILVIYFCLANNPKTLRLETTKPKKNKQTIILHFPRVRYLGEAWKWKWSSSIVSDSLWPHGHQAPPCMGFSRQEYWSGLPLPSPGNFPTQGSNPGLPHCRQTLYRLSHQGRGSAGCYCLRDSHSVAIKLSAAAPVIWRLDFFFFFNIYLSGCAGS